MDSWSNGFNAYKLDRSLYRELASQTACITRFNKWRDTCINGFILFMALLKHLFYRASWYLRPLLKYSGKKPLAVDIEFSNACNFRCVMCHQATGWLKKKDHRFVDWHVLRRVVKEARRLGVYSMKVNWRGEPTLDPECAEKILYMKDKGIHEVMMNTNGSKIDSTLAQKLITSGLDRIIFSCDGLNRETFNRIRKGGDFDTFMRNIKNFRVWRDCSRQRKPIIRVNVAIMEENKHEMKDVKKFFKDIADEIKFNTIYKHQDCEGEKRKKKRKGCPQIWQRLIVSVNGDIMPCCVDYQEKLRLGNIDVVSLERIWKERVKVIRDFHRTHRGRAMDGCRNCDNFALSEIKDGKVMYR